MQVKPKRRHMHSKSQERCRCLLLFSRQLIPKIESVVTEQAPTTLEWKHASRKKNKVGRDHLQAELPPTSRSNSLQA